MNKADVLRFLKALNATQVTHRSGWVQASCPLAPFTHQSGTDAHPSFAIEVADDRESIYNCFSCGGGDLIGLVHLLAHHGAKAPRYDLKTAMELAVADGDRPIAFAVKEWGEEAEAEPYVTFPELWLATFMSALQSPRAMKYLYKRRLSDELIERLDLRYDTSLDTVCFPIRDFHGTLCGLRGRRIAPSGEQPRYHMYGNHDKQRNNSVWYGEAWLDFDQPLLIVESVFDLASVLPLYDNVCAPLSVSFSEAKAKRLKQAVEIVTLFDADKGGDKARSRIGAYLPAARLTHVIPPDGTDPGDLTEIELRGLLTGWLKLKKPPVCATMSEHSKPVQSNQQH